MGYIVDHEIIKSWNMYKSIIYIKNGLHIGPLLGLNVVQYTKPLTSFKNAQGSPKNGLRRSAIAIRRTNQRAICPRITQTKKESL